MAAPQSHSQHGTGSTGNSPAAMRQHPPVLGSSPSSSCSSVPTKQNRESVKHLQTSPQSPPGSVDMPPSLAAHPRLCRNTGDGEGGGKWYPPAASNPPPAPCRALAPHREEFPCLFVTPAAQHDAACPLGSLFIAPLPSRARGSGDGSSCNTAGTAPSVGCSECLRCCSRPKRPAKTAAPASCSSHKGSCRVII